MSVPITDFICSITHDLAYEPVVCLEGHLFDRPAILRWLTQSQTCPISRQTLSVRNLVPLPFLTSLMPIRPADAIQPVTSRITPLLSIIDLLGDYEPMPALVTLVNVQPFGSDQFFDVPFDYVQQDYANIPMWNSRGRQLFVMRHDRMFNQLTHSASLLVNVSQANANYVRSFFIRDRVCRYTKYLYSHFGDLPSAIIRASASGLFVYDMFYLARQAFILYSFPRRIDGTLHNLHISSLDESVHR